MGAVAGNRIRILEETVHSFKGIPYAEPPIGELRFKNPLPLQHPWSGIRNATTFGNACWQQSDTMFLTAATDLTPSETLSEDCLYLNIWTPESAHNAAVMLWFHGGSFFWGAGSISLYNGGTLAAVEKVVVVTVNYRLGAFGFLTLKHTDIRGNMGMMDQVLAIEWVKENIRYFGGDPDKITLVGQSAGGASVTYHLLSHVGRNNFRRAIVQSGTSNSPALDPKTMDETNHYAQLLSADLGCVESIIPLNITTSLHDLPTPADPIDYSIYEENYESSSEVTLGEIDQYFENHATEVIACLRTREPIDFVTSLWSFGLHFPTIDDAFIRETPADSINGEDFKRTELLIGMNENEAAVNLLRMNWLPRENDSVIDASLFHQRIQDFYRRDQNDNILAETTAFMYRDWYDKHNPEKLRDAYEDIVGDHDIKCPSIEFARTYSASDSTQVYMYQYTHRPSLSSWPEWMGCVHGDELAFVFGHPLHMENGYTEEESNFSRKIMKYWANFAKTGNPNVDDPASDHHGNQWTRYGLDNLAYLTLNMSILNKTILSRGLRVPYCDFWRELVPKVTEGESTPKDTDKVRISTFSATTRRSFENVGSKFGTFT
ncbi:cholinesterase-like [Saccoglossus kowalevskii]|uniref:Carboxylic ester hydrolase n=1 Tax=Saccoglossus kowalevskii TaxID=10224 RepID=A0ABM0MZ37_SACKO|nr:PREDICTED: acetylcholinesterase-like [Saccoglossus kowalevskii]